MNACDIAFLCLPDAAAREAAALARSPGLTVIDTSTAHRVAPGWVYGFPELTPGQEEKIRAARRIANPGCYATGFIALVRPLVAAGALDTGAAISAHALSGYTGAGKSAIAVYESPDRPAEYASPRAYALGLAHKHLPEMMAMTGLARRPIFCPVVCDYPCGMTGDAAPPPLPAPGAPGSRSASPALWSVLRGPQPDPCPPPGGAGERLPGGQQHGRPGRPGDFCYGK